LVKQIHFN
jgi:hypothetical protein